MRTAFISAVFCFVTIALSGCHGGRLATPNGFATLDSDDSFSYRSANAQGVVLGVRTEDNDVKANVDFWADTLDIRLRNSGYAFQSKDAPRSRGGLQGRQLRYEISRDGRMQNYWVTVFSTEKKVYIVEAAGDKEAFDSAAVESAIEGLKI